MRKGILNLNFTDLEHCTINIQITTTTTTTTINNNVSDSL